MVILESVDKEIHEWDAIYAWSDWNLRCCRENLLETFPQYVWLSHREEGQLATPPSYMMNI